MRDPRGWHANPPVRQVWQVAVDLAISHCLSPPNHLRSPPSLQRYAPSLCIPIDRHAPYAPRNQRTKRKGGVEAFLGTERASQGTRLTRARWRSASLALFLSTRLKAHNGTRTPALCEDSRRAGVGSWPGYLAYSLSSTLALCASPLILILVSLDRGRRHRCSLGRSDVRDTDTSAQCVHAHGPWAMSR